MKSDQSDKLFLSDRAKFFDVYQRTAIIMVFVLSEVSDEIFMHRKLSFVCHFQIKCWSKSVKFSFLSYDTYCHQLFYSWKFLSDE